jgi:hypothetical protein
MLGRISQFSRVNKTNPCPICGKTHWCRFGILTDIDGTEKPVAICNRVKSEYEMKDNGGGYIHFLNEIPASVVLQSVVQRKNNHIAPIERRDMIYKDFLSHFHMSEVAVQSFVNARGFDAKTIKYLGYKEYDRNQVFRISQELFAKYGDLTGIPGAYLKEKNGCQYWMFGGLDKTVLLPSRALHKDIFVQGPIQAINYRIPWEEKNKYRYLSSTGKLNGTSSGAPIHISIPQNIRRYDVLGITEGIIKADYWANQKGIIVLSVMGVSTWKSAIHTVQQILSKTPMKGAIVAFDADKKINEYVKLYEKSLVYSLKKTGIKVAIANWDLQKGKGIDDLFKNGYSPEYKII